jgi:hypothetical protein
MASSGMLHHLALARTNFSEEDGILNCHRRENLKSYKFLLLEILLTITTPIILGT